MATNALLGPSWSYEGSGAKPEDEKDFASLQTRIQRAIATLAEFDQKIMETHIEDKVSVNPSGRQIVVEWTTCILLTPPYR